MPNQIRNSLGPLFCYHGCDKSVGEAVLTGAKTLKPSSNDYDWLGPGIYFWVDSHERALEWAESSSNIRQPFVIGAYILPGLCLNLTDYGIREHLEGAYYLLRDTCEKSETPLPRNSHEENGILLARHLDCAVINTLHQSREEGGEEAYQTVYGVFEEGRPIYPGAGIKEKTHVQIAVRDEAVVMGYFRVPGY